ncbi:4214_t:CDS:2, partial [Acaulospora morrowiae]
PNGHGNEWKNWTSGSDEVDEFIHEIQRNANESREFIEWIPYDKFKNVEYVARGGFGSVSKAVWTEGYVKWWDCKRKIWKRSGEDSWDGYEVACLKSLDHFSKEFFQEIKNQLKFRKSNNAIAVYGITKNPEGGDFVMVMQYAEKGSLRSMLNENYNKLNWKKKLDILRFIASGLSEIHKEGLVHKDFHSGNIMMADESASYITDFGLCKPIISNPTRDNKIFGVLPYVAPEVLRGKDYTSESDVYSFGVIMTEVFTGYPPYHDVSNDVHLMLSICNGLRPRIRRPVPRLLLDLIHRCLDEKLENRPSSSELTRTLKRYYVDVNLENEESEIYRQVISIEEDIARSQQDYSIDFSQLNSDTHSTAVYTSRLLPRPDLFSA